MTESSYTLFQLNGLVKSSLKNAFEETIWVTAEIHEMNENATGHCYLELVEKSEKSDQIIARAKATIWVITWRMLKPYFETATGQEFQSGLKVLVNVSVEFHELYGYSLNIKDIDPIYTLGDLEKKKAEIIRRLEMEGISDMNKNLNLEPVPQRIAVISSSSAAGYQDFMHQIENNPYGYQFAITLYAATMQGKQAEASILEKLDKINSEFEKYDAVVLIRGGGSKSDLNCFNSYEVASHIAQFPLPVITGIGHERDTTIADLVAHTRMKTPTAVAEFLISRLENFESMVVEIENKLFERATIRLNHLKKMLIGLSIRIFPSIKNRIIFEKNHTMRLGTYLPEKVKNYIFRKFYDLRPVKNELKKLLSNRFKSENIRNKQSHNGMKLILQKFLEKIHYQLRYKEHIIHLNHPEQILQKGFAIVRLNGKMVKSAKTLKKSDNIETKFKDGRIESIVGRLDLSD